eukprot:1327321-Heterocapsa_arctica.AAC.1
MSSLIGSRLFYNIHALTMTTVGLRHLNGPYMHILRLIAAVPRFSAECGVSDLDVRRQLGVPSIDFVVLRRRI